MALSPGSPAIDAGDPAFAPPPATDQRGFNRVAGGRVDIGAFEYQKADTATDLSASATSLADGQSVTLTAKVTATSGTPTGSVTFKDGNTTLETVSLDANGVATLTTKLAPGAHSLTAVYSGDSEFNPTKSSAVSVTVAPPLAGDVTAQVTVTRTPAPHCKGMPVRALTLTLVNSSGQVIEGPLTVVLKGLKPTVKLRGATDFTGRKKHRRPFVVLTPPGNLFQPGEQLSLLLRFRGKPNHFTTTVKAGSAKP
jgi:Bacterial Ig-like domain (group 3)